MSFKNYDPQKSRARRIRKGQQPAVRLCACGAPTWSPKAPYCGLHSALAADRPRSARRAHELSSTARGYGPEHQKLRRRWQPKVERGGVACWRCGQLIVPGAPWDLGHDDLNRSIYMGPEHVRCNRATASRRRKAQ